MAGSRKNIPNKTTKRVKELLCTVMENGVDEFMTRMGRLDDKTYCEIYEKLMRYVIPRCTQADIDVTTGNKEIVFKFGGDD